MSTSADQARASLGIRLRGIRRDAGLSSTALAQRAGWQASKVSKIEHGRQTPSEGDLGTWCEHCRTPEQLPDLVAAVRSIETQFAEWRRIMRGGTRRRQQASAAVYERARLFRIYEPAVVPGLLQTREYAVAVLSTFISQFLDLGAGLPAAPNTHQVARAVNPAASTTYVDTDPVALSRARALLATSDGVTAIAADLRDPAAVLADSGLRAVIDPARPVTVILGAVLHLLNAAAARQVTARYVRQMAPGSCLIISAPSFDDEALGKRLAAEYTAGPLVNHAPADIASFFAGLDMAGPGLADAAIWRPWISGPTRLRREGHVLAGVARHAQQP